MAGCSTCGGARAGFHREWWYYRDGAVVLKTTDQGEANQAQTDAGGAGRIERRIVADTPTDE